MTDPHRRHLPAGRDRRCPGRLPVPGERLPDRRRRQDRRLQPHRPGLQPAAVLLGPAFGRRRQPTATTRSSSAGSNLGPTSQDLIERITAEVDRLREANGDGPVPVDLVTASASGLDPDISPAAAEYQVARVAAARSMTEDEVRAVVARHTEQPLLGFLGQPRVNVLLPQPRPRRPGVELVRPMRYPERDALRRLAPTRGRDAGARSRRDRRGIAGRLRVYLGMAPGVGKTYRMLEEGHRRVERGTDVVVGFVEAHGRPETETLARRPRDRPAPADRVSRRRRRGDGHRRHPCPPAVRRPDRRAGPHERARVGEDKALAGRGGRPRRRASTSSAPATSSTSSRSPTLSPRSPARRSTSGCRTRSWRPPTRSSSST